MSPPEHAHLPVHIYTPESELGHPLQLLRAIWADLREGQHLAWTLATRDISSQYRQSALGILWAFMSPLFGTVTWLFLTATKVVQVAETPIPYPVFVFSGTVLWSVLIDAFNAPRAETGSAMGMMGKLNFPREALILSGIYKVLFNTAIRLGLLALVLPFTGVYAGWGALLLPLGVLSLVLVGTALGLLITPVGLLFNDVGRIIGPITGFAMYLSPVVFPMATSGWTAPVMRWNPLTPLIVNARAWFTGMPPEMLTEYLIVNIAAVFLLIGAWMAYRTVMPILLERLT